MRVSDLFEEKKEHLLPVDEIAMLLFKKRAGIVKDAKRDKDKDYLGVAHHKSTLKGRDGKHLHLTFDNSTDSGEFEIDSLTPLKIEKGGEVDRAIKKLFSKHDLDTKKKVGYVVKSDAAYVREIHLGKKLGRPAVKLVGDLLKLLRGSAKPEKSEEEPEEKEEKPVKKEENPVKKEEKKD